MIFMTAILSLTMVSAASSITIVTPINVPSTVNHDVGSYTFTFDVQNTGTSTTVDFDSSLLTSGHVGSISIPSTLVGVGTTQIIATVTLGPNQDGFIAGTIKAKPADDVLKSEDFGPTEISTSNSLSLTSTTLSESQTQATLTLTNNGNTVLNSITLSSEPLSGVTTTINPTSISQLAAGDSQTITEIGRASCRERV